MRAAKARRPEGWAIAARRGQSQAGRSDRRAPQPAIGGGEAAPRNPGAACRHRNIGRAFGAYRRRAKAGIFDDQNAGAV